jgi:hypothetical protein
MFVLNSCEPSSRLYRLDDNVAMYFGHINEGTYNQIKQFLSSENTQLKDTIIIKYDYNNETCWDRMDERNDSSIMTSVKYWQKHIQQKMTARQNLTVFHYREPGNDLNKIIKPDSSILIHDKKILLNLLFKKRTTCGSSIIIMPDKRFLFIRSDSHFEALEMSKQQIEDVLNKKN